MGWKGLKVRGLTGEGRGMGSIKAHTYWAIHNHTDCILIDCHWYETLECICLISNWRYNQPIGAPIHINDVHSSVSYQWAIFKKYNHIIKRPESSGDMEGSTLNQSKKHTHTPPEPSTSHGPVIKTPIHRCTHKLLILPQT